MTPQKEPQRSLPWPPILYVGAVALAIVAHFLLPLPWIGPPMDGLLFAIGWVVAAGAVAMEAAAMRAMMRARTTIRPDRPPDHLVTSGPFSFTRNPIYLGNTMLMIGIGLISGILWFPILALVAAFATRKLAIEREEKLLAARFGKAFRDYSRRVRRWI